MLVGIDPKVDYAFKRVFGRDHPKNHQLLISLLNAVLRLPPGQQITWVQILNPFHDRETSEDRLAVVDIKVKDQQGRQYTIEMQMVLHPFFPERLLYYWARLYPQTLTTGQDYEMLRPTVVICFLNDVLWQTHPERYHWVFRVRDEQTAVVLTPHLAIHILELPKCQQAVGEVGDPLEQWLYFLQHAEELDTEHWPAQLQVPEIRQAAEELHMLSQDQLERERYEARLRVQRDESIRAKAARIYHETGFSEGLVEGKKEGLIEGEKKGLVEGEKKAVVVMIQRFQRGLKRAVTAQEELLAMSPEQLQTLMDQLEKEIFGPPSDQA